MASKTFSQLYNDGLRLADQTSGGGSALAKQIIQDGINESYSEISSIRDWKTLENNTTVSAVSGTEEYTPITNSTTIPRIRRIESVKDETNKLFISEERRENFEKMYPYVASTDTGTPSIWYQSGYTSTRDIKIKLYKIPNSSITYRVTYYEEPLALTADTDVPRIPDQFHYGLVYLGLAKYFEYEKEKIAEYYRQLNSEYRAKVLSNEWGDTDEMPEMIPQGRAGNYVTGKIGRIYNR